MPSFSYFIHVIHHQKACGAEAPAGSGPDDSPGSHSCSKETVVPLPRVSLTLPLLLLLPGALPPLPLLLLLALALPPPPPLPLLCVLCCTLGPTGGVLTSSCAVVADAAVSTTDCGGLGLKPCCSRIDRVTLPSSLRAMHLYLPKTASHFQQRFIEIEVFHFTSSQKLLHENNNSKNNKMKRNFPDVPNRVTTRLGDSSTYLLLLGQLVNARETPFIVAKQIDLTILPKITKNSLNIKQVDCKRIKHV
ncbi:F-box/kelch-repeat protein [Frankliniella fusca]|uniref:F-box/kelch-repeat protein n=1 Tax=Frankliniella fusca TaxID=407009 RepID=A0AAE1H9C2_9NEOP|nr:F-box/kelch-repeat protein [Frankliniella fusca]